MMRPWKIRFSLRSLLVAVAVLACFVAWTSVNYRASEKQRRAAEHLTALGFDVSYVEPEYVLCGTCAMFSETGNTGAKESTPVWERCQDIFGPPKIFQIGVGFANFVDSRSKLPEIAKHMSDLASVKRLEITYGGNEIFECISRMKSLDELALHNGSYDPRVFNRHRLPGNLARISLLWVDFEGDSPTIDLRSLRSLQGFAATYPAWGDDSSRYPKQVLLPRGLKSFSLGGRIVTEEMLRQVSLPRDLESFSLGCDVITDEMLTRLAGFPELRKLGIAAEKLPGDFLAHLSNPGALASLSVSCPTFTDQAVKRLAECRNLKELELFECAVTDDGFHAVEHLTLRRIELRGIQASDRTLQYVANPELEELVIRESDRARWEGRPWTTSRFPITDDGIAHLSSLPNLKTLHIEGLEITDEGLNRLLQLPKLQLLYLGSCPQVQSKTVNKLERQYPRVQLDVSTAEDGG